VLRCASRDFYVCPSLFDISIPHVERECEYGLVYRRAHAVNFGRRVTYGIQMECAKMS
jgi:hypothetical protein